MKILYTFFACVLSILNIAGQTYFAFPDSNCVWSVEKEKHLIKGDSIYNSITYKKYYTTTDTNLTPSSLQFVGLVRQDIPNKKIYGIASTYTTEALMYNFNLNVNDTLQVKPLIYFFWQTPRRIKVSAKDSVFVNGQYRKRLTLVTNVPFGASYPETWIEGIGSSCGPLSSGLADPPVICLCFPTLLCQKKNGSTIYVNPVHNSCYKTVCFGTGVKELTNNDNWKIYPNPTSNILNIDIKENIQNISVYNSNNQLVDNIEINKINKTIDFSKVSKGIYFIRISTPNKTVDKKVIIAGY
jgi:hypothetical protein